MVSRLLAPLLFSLLSLILTARAPAQAADRGLPQPTGEVILTVEGNIGQSNGAGIARFDREMLERLPTRTIVTRTPWTDKPITFSGPGLADLLVRLEARGSMLEMSGLNEYKVRIPAADAGEHGVILALRADGQVMRVRDKGPIWIIYPLDDKPGLRDSAPVKMVWQLRRIRVL